MDELDALASVTQDARTSGLTPLFYAVMAGRVDIAETLLDQGAQVNTLVKLNRPELTIAKGCNELHYAVWFQHGPVVTRQMVQLLIRHGIDTRKAMPGLGIQPIMGAAVAGHLDALEALIDHDETLGLERDFVGFPVYMVPSNAPNGKMALEFMRARYLEQFAAVKGRLSPFGMTYAAHSIGSAGHVDIAKMLSDELGEPINAAGPVKGTKAKIMTSSRARCGVAAQQESLFVDGDARVGPLSDGDVLRRDDVQPRRARGVARARRRRQPTERQEADGAAARGGSLWARDDLREAARGGRRCDAQGLARPHAHRLGAAEQARRGHAAPAGCAPQLDRTRGELQRAACSTRRRRRSKGAVEHRASKRRRRWRRIHGS